MLRVRQKRAEAHSFTDLALYGLALVARLRYLYVYRQDDTDKRMGSSLPIVYFRHVRIENGVKSAHTSFASCES